MMLEKRLDHGFSGYQVPRTPRAARSARKRCLFKSKDGGHEMRAFDLLATVAGKILLDGKEEKDEVKSPVEEKSCNYERNFLFTELVPENTDSKFCSNEQNDTISRPVSGIMTSDCSEKVGSAKYNDDCKLRLGIFSPTADVESSDSRKRINMDNSANNNSKNFRISNKRIDIRGHPEAAAWDRKPSALVSSVDSVVKFPLCGAHSATPTTSGPLPVNRDYVKLATRDDDDNNFSECNGNFRTRKLLASKHSITPLNVKDDYGNAEQCNYLARKSGSEGERSLRDYPFKKRKLYEYSLGSNSDDISDGTCNVPESANSGGPFGCASTLPRVTPTPPSATGEHASFSSRDAQVKLKIKSFRVPELFIEIPETATVASLKRTVLKAVNAVINGGVCVGIVLKGKKIRDDNKTLLQTGISHDNKMDSLGFTLEPGLTQATIQSCSEDRPSQLLDDSQLPARYPPTPTITRNAVQTRNLHTPSDLPRIKIKNLLESDHNSAPSLPDMSLQKTGTESQALVPLPAMKTDASAAIPLRKLKRSDSAQRRIRRPFTVAEVEALVQAVEKLGTGRWRDVKLRAFDSAKHRTYVDLKDKWKTLVHTARISPQQRRGEPVPQELLDRVLAAHAYWSQQQAKKQLKSQPNTCLLL